MLSMKAMRGPLAILLWARGMRDFGDGFVAVLLPLYLTRTGFSPFEIGALAGAANRFLNPDELSLFSDKCREKAGSASDPSRRSHWLRYSEVASAHLNV